MHELWHTILSRACFQGRLIPAPVAEARRLLLERGRAHFSGSEQSKQYKLPLLEELSSFKFKTDDKAEKKGS